jgi:hypothetical protein
MATGVVVGLVGIRQATSATNAARPGTGRADDVLQIPNSACQLVDPGQRENVALAEDAISTSRNPAAIFVDSLIRLRGG